MTESTLATMHAIINEAEFSSDVLRIIAERGRRLTAADCQQMRIAADQLEAAFHDFHIVVEKLVETRLELQAKEDALMEVRKLIPAPFVGLEMTATLPFNPYILRS